RRDVVGDAGRGFTERGADGDRVGVVGEGAGKLFGLYRLTPGSCDVDRLHAERFAEVSPAFAKTTGAEADRLAVRRDTIDEGRFQTAGAGTGQREDRVLGAVDVAQVFEHLREHLAELGRPVAEDRLGQLQE